MLLSLIVSSNSKISLRIIDWFVTNYSKKNNTNYSIDMKLNNKIIKKQFIVYINYKLQLKGYSKKQFDPFCRRNRINFYFDETDYITTTVGQLNFFRWALQNNVVDYIVNHYKEIEVDMNDNTKKQRQNTKVLKDKHLEDITELVQNELVINKNINHIQTKERKKRQPLSVAATNNMNMNKVQVLLNFD